MTGKEKMLAMKNPQQHPWTKGEESILRRQMRIMAEKDRKIKEEVREHRRRRGLSPVHYLDKIDF